jgi:periplasmic copper chaperone A
LTFDQLEWNSPMKNSFAIKILALCSALTWAGASFGHIVLADQAALAGTSYRATLRVGHGCEGAPINAIRVTIPAGLQGAKPMPKPGWTLTIKTAKLAKPYTSHGKQISEDVSEITWTANAPEHWLPDAYYDEFVLRGGLPLQAGAMWFKVLQTCEKGSIDWAQVPVSGTSTKGLKYPAALLEIIESGAAGHQH